MKAAVANYFLEFLVEVLTDKRDSLRDGVLLLRAGSSLLELVRLCRLPVSHFDAETCQRFFDAARTHLESCEDLEFMGMKPKHHALQHMVVRSHTRCSPGWAGNWFNEGVNRLVKASAAVAHRTRFTTESSWISRRGSVCDLQLSAAQLNDRDFV